MLATKVEIKEEAIYRIILKQSILTVKYIMLLNQLHRMENFYHCFM